MARVAVNCLLFVTSLVMALAVAELAVRTVIPQQLIVIRPDIWQPVDGLGWMHRANLDTWINTGEGPARLITDEQGFRIGESSPVQANTEVLLIGDSFMAALQVNHENTLAGLMETGLAQTLGQPVTVRNAGVGAWDPPQYLIRARSLLAAKHYALVVVAVYVGNDIVARRTERFPPVEPVSVAKFRIPREATKEELVEALLRPFNDRMETASHLFVFVKNRLNALRMKFGLSAAYFPDGFRFTEANDTKWAVTLDILGDLAQEAENAQTPILFLLLPADFQVDQRIFQEYVQAFDLDVTDVDLDQPNRILQEGLRAKGIEVLDALPALRLAHERGVFGYGRIDTHFNADGHRVVWEWSRQRMVELIERSP